MRRCIPMLLLLVSACAPAIQTSGEALCLSTAKGRTAHAAALASSPDDRAAVTGANLIETIDAACAAGK